VSKSGWNYISGLRGTTTSIGSVDYASLAVQVGSCLFSGSPETKARCVFNAILAAGERTDEGGVILAAVATGTCSQFLTAAGLNATAGSAVCSVLSPFWGTFQRWAADELYQIQNERYLASIRMEEIPLDEGGGYRIVTEDGIVHRVCPILTTTAGWILTELGPGQTCTQFETSSATRTPVAKRSVSDRTFIRSGDAPSSSSVPTIAVVGGIGLLGILAWMLLA